MCRQIYWGQCFKLQRSSKWKMLFLETIFLNIKLITEQLVRNCVYHVKALRTMYMLNLRYLIQNWLSINKNHMNEMQHCQEQGIQKTEDQDLISWDRKQKLLSYIGSINEFFISELGPEIFYHPPVLRQTFLSPSKFWDHVFFFF